MKREVTRSIGLFHDGVRAVCLLWIATAANAIFRPEGWNEFVARYATEPNIRVIAFDAAWLVGPLAVLLAVTFRLIRVRHKHANAAVMVLAIAASGSLFFLGLEPYFRLYLHKSGYDARVDAQPGDPVVVFDWGETARPFGRRLEYLVFARGDHARTFQHFIDLPEANRNQEDEGT